MLLILVVVVVSASATMLQRKKRWGLFLFKRGGSVVYKCRFWDNSLKQSSHSFNSLTPFNAYENSPLLYHTLTRSHSFIPLLLRFCLNSLKIAPDSYAKRTREARILVQLNDFENSPTLYESLHTLTR